MKDVMKLSRVMKCNIYISEKKWLQRVKDNRTLLMSKPYPILDNGVVVDHVMGVRTLYKPTYDFSYGIDMFNSNTYIIIDNQVIVIKNNLAHVLDDDTKQEMYEEEFINNVSFNMESVDDIDKIINGLKNVKWYNIHNTISVSNIYDQNNINYGILMDQREIVMKWLYYNSNKYIAKHIKSHIKYEPILINILDGKDADNVYDIYEVMSGNDHNNLDTTKGGDVCVN